VEEKKKSDSEFLSYNSRYQDDANSYDMFSYGNRVNYFRGRGNFNRNSGFRGRDQQYRGRGFYKAQ
jgi:hypothetical protein